MKIMESVLKEDGKSYLLDSHEPLLTKPPRLQDHRHFLIALAVKFFLFNCVLITVVAFDGIDLAFVYGFALVYLVMLPIYSLVVIAIPRESLILFIPALILTLVCAFVLYLNLFITALRFASHRGEGFSFDVAHLMFDTVLVACETMLLVYLCRSFSLFMDQLQIKETGETDSDELSTSTWSLHEMDTLEEDEEPKKPRSHKIGLC